MNLKKIIALVLCVCMVLSFFPVSVFAEEWDEEIVLTDEEYYEEPQEEYVEEIIEEEPADYVEYVELVEEIVVEEPVEEPVVEELVPAEDAVVVEETAPAGEAVAEQPAADTAVAAEPKAETAAVELETAETFNKAAVAQIGNTPYGSLAEALTEAQAGDTITLLGDSENTNPISIGKSVTIDGQSLYTISVNSSTENRVIDISDTSDVTLTLKNVTIDASKCKPDQTRGVSMYGNENVKLVLDHATINCPYYAINVAGANNGVTVEVTNSSVAAGWAGINVWSPATISVTGSTISGKNDKSFSAEGWNNFSTVVMNKDKDNTTSGSVLTFTNSTIAAETTTGNAQWLVDLRDGGITATFTGCTFTLTGTPTQDGKHPDVMFAFKGTTTENVTLTNCTFTKNNISITDVNDLFDNFIFYSYAALYSTYIIDSKQYAVGTDGEVYEAVPTVTRDAEYKFTAGTFYDDPSASVARGYVAVKNGDVYNVIEADANSTTITVEPPTNNNNGTVTSDVAITVGEQTKEVVVTYTAQKAAQIDNVTNSVSIEDPKTVDTEIIQNTVSEAVIAAIAQGKDVTDITATISVNAVKDDNQIEPGVDLAFSIEALLTVTSGDVVLREEELTGANFAEGAKHVFKLPVSDQFTVGSQITVKHTGRSGTLPDEYFYPTVQNGTPRFVEVTVSDFSSLLLSNGSPTKQDGDTVMLKLSNGAISYYTTIDAALAEAEASGSTIKLIGAPTENYVESVNKSFDLDLGEQTLSADLYLENSKVKVVGKGTLTSAVELENNAKLTIESDDVYFNGTVSSDDGTGTAVYHEGTYGFDPTEKIPTGYAVVTGQTNPWRVSKSHTLTKNLNYESSTPIVETFYEYTAYALTDPPVRTGWTFGGWYEQSATDAITEIPAHTTSDVAVEAKWAQAEVYAAQVGENKYATLAEAIGFGAALHEPVKLLSDQEYSGTLQSEIGFKLNGFTLTVPENKTLNVAANTVIEGADKLVLTGNLLVGDGVTLTLDKFGNPNVANITGDGNAVLMIGTDTYNWVPANGDNSGYWKLEGAVAVNWRDEITFYKTLSAAIDDANASEEVVLLADVDIDTPIAINKNLTLDLNGHKIISTARNPIVVSAEVTITSSSSGDAGTILDNSNASASRAIRVNNTGNLTLSGNLVIDTNGTFSIYNAGTLTINQEHVYVNKKLAAASGATTHFYAKDVNDEKVVSPAGVAYDNKGYEKLSDVKDAAIDSGNAVTIWNAAGLDAITLDRDQAIMIVPGTGSDITPAQIRAKVTAASAAVDYIDVQNNTYTAKQAAASANGVNYGTVQDAVDAIVGEETGSVTGTITLANKYITEDNITIPDNATITLEMPKSRSIATPEDGTRPAFVVNGTLTVMHTGTSGASTITTTGENASFVFVVNEGGALNLIDVGVKGAKGVSVTKGSFSANKNVTVKGTAGEALNFTDCDADKVMITAGTYVGEEKDIDSDTEGGFISGELEGHVLVSQPYFGHVVPNAYLAEGFAPVYTAEGGKYTIQPGSIVAEITNSSGVTRGFASLQEAVNNAAENDTIKIVATKASGAAVTDPDYILPEGVTINKSLTLDLNGKTIYNPEAAEGTSQQNAITVTAGTLTVNDSSSTKNGAIYSDVDVKSSAIFLNGGSAIINAGNFGGGNAGVTVVKASSALTVYNGTLGKIGDEVTSKRGINVTFGKAITIHGGSIEGTNCAVLLQKTIDSDFTFVVDGGEESTVSKIEIGKIINSSDKVAMTLNDATITSIEGDGKATIVVGADCTITGNVKNNKTLDVYGTVNGNITNVADDVNDGDNVRRAVVVDGGTVVGNITSTTGTVLVKGDALVKGTFTDNLLAEGVTSDKITKTPRFINEITDANCVDPWQVTTVVDDDVNYYTVIKKADAKASLTYKIGAESSVNYYADVQEAANVAATLKSNGKPVASTIKMLADDANRELVIPVANDNAITLNLDTYAIKSLTNNGSGAVTVNGKTPADGYSIDTVTAESGNITLASGNYKVANLTATAPKAVILSGGTYDQDVKDKTEGIVKLANNKTAYKTSANAVVWTVGSVKSAKASVSTVDPAVTTQYSTLPIAMQVAVAGDTVTLLDDYTAKKATDVFTVDKNLTIDLNGSKFSMDDAVDAVPLTVTGGTVLIKSSVDEEEVDAIGEISANDGYSAIVVTGGTLTINSANLEISGGGTNIPVIYAESEKNPTVRIVNGTVKNVAAGGPAVADDVDTTPDEEGTAAAHVISLTGGNYYSNDPKDYVATSYTSFKRTDSAGFDYYSVVLNDNIEAQVRANNAAAPVTYATLQDALNAVKKNGIVDLLKDVEGPVEFNRNSINFTLNLNGHELTSDNETATLKNSSSSTLIIIDEPLAEGTTTTGTIKNTGAGSAVNTTAALNINGGKFESASEAIATIAAELNKQVTVNDGEFKNVRNVDGVIAYGPIFSGSDNKVILNGGSYFKAADEKPESESAAKLGTNCESIEVTSADKRVLAENDTFDHFVVTKAVTVTVKGYYPERTENDEVKGYVGYPLYASDFNETVPQPTRTGYQYTSYKAVYSDVTTTGSFTLGTTPVAGTLQSIEPNYVGISYSVKFHVNGGEGQDEQVQEGFVYGTNKKLTTLAELGYSAPEGTVFFGWGTQPDSTTGLKADGSAQKSLTTEDGATVDLYAIWNGAVAKIGDVGYSTVAAAITAANAGETIVLQTNVPGFTFSAAKAVIFDLNGFNVEGGINVNNASAILTLSNSNDADTESIVGTATTTNGLVVTKGRAFVSDGVTITGKTHAISNAAGGSVEVIGGKINGEMANANETADTFVLSGGLFTYSVDDLKALTAITVKNNYEIVAFTGSEYQSTVVEIEAATIGTVSYPTLQMAIDSVEGTNDSATEIVLQRALTEDVTVSGQNIKINLNATKLDLEEGQAELNGSIKLESGSVEVANGTISKIGQAIRITGNNTKFVLAEDAAIDARYGVTLGDGASNNDITLDGDVANNVYVGESAGAGNVITVNGSVKSTGPSNNNYSKHAIDVEAEATVTVANTATIYSTNGDAIKLNNANAVLTVAADDAEATAQIEGQIGIEMNAGKFTLNGGEIVGNTDVALKIDSGVEADIPATSTAYLSSKADGAIAVESQDVYGFIKGGTYSSDVFMKDEGTNLCALQYVTVKLDNRYKVTKCNHATSIEVGATYCALCGAKIKLTVVLTSSGNGGIDGPSIANVTGAGRYNINESVTIKANPVAGYEFMGWYDKNTTNVFNEMEVTIDPITQDYDLVAVYEITETSGVQLTVHGTKFTINGGAPQRGLYNEMVPVGSYEIEYTANVGTFKYWVNQNGKVMSRQNPASFYIAGATNLTAVVDGAEEGEALVVFTTAGTNGQLISQKYYSSDATAISFPAAPDVAYKTFTGWSMEEADILAAIKAGKQYIEVTPKYTSTGDTYTVKVFAAGVELDDDQIEEIVVEAGKAYTTKAAPEFEGKKFSHWSSDKDGEMVIGRSEQYTGLSPNKVDVNIYAQYVNEDVPVVKAVTVNLEAGTTSTASKNNIVFSASRTVPQEFTLKSAGILVISAQDLKDAEPTDVLVVGSSAEGMRTKVTSSTIRNDVYTVSFNMGQNTGLVLYARAFVVYENDEGVTETVYSGVDSRSFLGRA